MTFVDNYGGPADQPTPAPAPTAAPDMAKIDRNLNRLIEANAPDEDIRDYLRAEGVTPEQALEAKRGMFERVKDTVGGALSTAKEAVTAAVEGQQDPAFADVPGFTGEGLDVETRSQIERGKLVTITDTAYGDVVKNALGPRLIDSQKDKFGQEIVTYRGDDGTEHRAYVNKPGLDVQDVGRAAAAAMPYVVTGGLSATVMKGLPFLARMVGQGVAAVTASLGSDVAAERMGSKEGVDLPRAGVAGGTGMAGEALSPLVAAVWRRLVIKPGMIENGKLTAAGRTAARDAGLGPEEIAAMESGRAEQFAQEMSYARDPSEVGRQIRAGEFDIPTTKGQRTNDPRMLQMEQEMRKGLWGEQGKRIMDEFDKNQTQRVEGAVREQIGGALAPEAPGVEKATLGRSVHEGIQTAKAYVDQAENQLWGAVGPLRPKAEAYDLLAPRIKREFDAAGVVPKPATATGGAPATPKTIEMLQSLEKFSQGKDVFGKTPLLGPQWKQLTLDDMRRELLAVYKDAEPGSYDAKGAKAVYDGFNNWIGEMADAAMLKGDPASAAALVTARAFTRDVKQMFSPRDASGRLTPAGRRLDSVLNRNDSPESVVDALVPQPRAKLRAGDVETLKHLKAILTGNGAADAWNDVRLAYWVRIAQNDRGKILSPKLLRDNIEKAFENQKSALDVLFSPDEQSLMKRLGRALEEATWTDPNPSGTSYALESMRRRFQGGSVLKTLLQTQAKRELFSKHNVLLSRLYQVLARKVPVSFFGSAERAGAAAASRMVSPEVTARRAPSFAGPAAAVGAEVQGQ